MKKPKNKKGFFSEISESEITVMIAREDDAGIFFIYETIERKKLVLKKLKELKDWLDKLIKFLESRDVRDKN